MNRLTSFLICIFVGTFFWFIPLSPDIPKAGQEVFAVFLAVIASFLLRPLPMGALVLLGLISLLITKTVTMDQALSGYGDSIVWLVVAAFLISGAVVETGFGKRVALFFISKFGKNIFGIAYGLCASEFLLGPVVPSNTARGGGVHAPLERSLSEALSSYPDDWPDRAGSYLSLVGSHANMVTAGMFLTGMAANPLLAAAASEILYVNLDWLTWAKGTIVPGLVSLFLLPLLIYKVAKPELRDTREVQKQVKDQYRALGASGPCIIYFGQGYVPLARWFRVGFLVSLYHITIWFTVEIAGLVVERIRRASVSLSFFRRDTCNGIPT